MSPIVEIFEPQIEESIVDEEPGERFDFLTKNRFSNRTTEVDPIYGIKPLPAEERFEQPDPIISDISKIDQGGTIYIEFSPPIVFVSDTWKQIFNAEERSQLID